jgi:hypothetical protein
MRAMMARSRSVWQMAEQSSTFRTVESRCGDLQSRLQESCTGRIRVCQMFFGPTCITKLMKTLAKTLAVNQNTHNKRNQFCVHVQKQPKELSAHTLVWRSAIFVVTRAHVVENSSRGLPGLASFQSPCLLCQSCDDVMPMQPRDTTYAEEKDALARDSQ